MSTLRFLSKYGRTALYVGARQQQHHHQRHQLPAIAASFCTKSQRNDNNTNRTCYTNDNNNNNKSANQPNFIAQWPFMKDLQNAVNLYTQKPQQQSQQQQFSTKPPPPCHACKSEAKASTSASASSITDTHLFGETSNLGLFAKFKLMYKKYWYVLIPVHVVTSIGWFGAFFYMCKSGVDVPALLQYMHLSETIIEKVQGSEMGNIALAYLCYKVATPLRYAVTLGGTTVSIKYLVQAGHIKPMLSKKQLIDLYEQKKADRAASKADKE